MKNIIFDLGAVIIDLDLPEMSRRFESLGVKDFQSHFNLNKQGRLFTDLEEGLISPEAFCEGLRELFKIEASDEAIIQAWNGILTDFRPERMALLERLSKDFKLYLFSNTNKIHADCFEASCQKTCHRSLQSYFTASFYSHDIHDRKPRLSSFEAVCQLAGIKAEETVFIDDNADNVAGAREAGLQAYHLLSPETILELDYEQWKK
ncbi:HAD family hydrolase [Lactococcus termiticola]|uniref:HAD family hydrolase n=1 Tax=Lactococcus termiticola TaxID=2169526 RepID=A0A2R5HFT5_9LACT|nr:HAD family phosphatase [Lactococcus termiticola]GBG96919.1 HAD family hydrolase [Lactococcus termiticola]